MVLQSFTGNYSGRAEKPIIWDDLLRIFDLIWGEEWRSLPSYPKVIGGVYAGWLDAKGTKFMAEKIDEIEKAYKNHETFLISIQGMKNGVINNCSLDYWPGKAIVQIEVESEKEVVDKIITLTKTIFPLEDKVVFISYDTDELELAEYVENIIKKRLLPHVKTFLAKQDIKPGDNPSKKIFEQALFFSEALVVLCSQKSKSSPWIWWEASAVWARKKLVIPFFVNILPEEFGGPIPLVLQGVNLFDESEINSALCELVKKVCPEHLCKNITPEEIKELNKWKV